MTPYQILGISPGASVDEVKKAYKKLAILHHPDKGGCPEKFKQISQAYSTIMSVGNNDQQLFDNFDDFLKSIFKNKKTKPIKSVSITLEEAFAGKDIQIGSDLLTLVPGIREIKYPFKNYIINVNIVPHKIFKRSMNDLMTEVKLTWYEALFGKTCEILHLSGSNIKFKILENSYKDQIIKLRGLGMPDPRNKDLRGDLYIKVDVERLTKKNLTSSLLDAIIVEYKNSINETKIIR